MSPATTVSPPGIAALAASTSRLAAWAGDSADAPPYNAPTAFTIGCHTTGPFVRTQQLKEHLALLHAFADLKTKVEALADGEIAQMPSDTERRWAWFVGLAVERFEKWCKALRRSDAEVEFETVLPPIDVLMVWHAYLLNPGWYAEDVERMPELEGLHKAGDALVALLAGDLSISEPSPARIDQWGKLTVTPFDPFEAAPHFLCREVICPKCSDTVPAPYMTDGGTGYLQQGFLTRCPNKLCQFKITHDSLALRKLALDMSQHRRRTLPQRWLAGTVHTPSNPFDWRRGWAIRDALLRHEKLERPAGNKPGTFIPDAAYAQFIMQQAMHHFGTLKTLLMTNVKEKGRKLIGRIVSAYTNDRLFSVELVGAVLRQGTFVSKMHALQWTRPGFFDNAEDEIALLHAIARYHAFLDLMSVSPNSFLVPTLDIDLAWHTHQLLASSYAHDTVKYVGRFIDHDDKVEQSQLASSFDTTHRAWEDRYGVKYMYCGCPLPGATIGQKLSLFRLRPLRSNSPSVESRGELVPPSRADLLAATHPSDHNAVRVAFGAEATQRTRREKTAKRDEDIPPSHDPAFLIPVPLDKPSNATTCAATSGSVIKGDLTGRCAVGTGACSASGAICGSGAGWESAGGSSVGGRKTNVKAGRGGLFFYIGEREARKRGHGGAEWTELFSEALESGLSLACQSQQSGCGGSGAGGTASCGGGSGVGGCGGGSGGGGSGCGGG
ncbi:hypothetical protein B0H19DRAFT_1151153 [Mycena capillaripes]|nr:hypothetical protein B0H19DRAFT_1151153 [Mycena capillaripes]